MSLVRSLLTQVEQLRLQHGAATVTRIEVELGPLSGVEPLLVSDAFERLVPATNSPGAELAIREVPLGGICRDCGNDFVVESFRFECPGCGSRSVQVSRGDEFRLLNVTLDGSSDANHDHARNEVDAPVASQAIQ
ncbi:MAG: hydrogenase maturation nickel metallochaperone HypA [Planctomycetaceae bacterium]